MNIKRATKTDSDKSILTEQPLKDESLALMQHLITFALRFCCRVWNVIAQLPI